MTSGIIKFNQAMKTIKILNSSMSSLCVPVCTLYNTDAPDEIRDGPLGDLLPDLD